MKQTFSNPEDAAAYFAAKLPWNHENVPPTNAVSAALYKIKSSEYNPETEPILIHSEKFLDALEAYVNLTHKYFHLVKAVEVSEKKATNMGLVIKDDGHYVVELLNCDSCPPCSSPAEVCKNIEEFITAHSGTPDGITLEQLKQEGVHPYFVELLETRLPQF